MAYIPVNSKVSGFVFEQARGTVVVWQWLGENAPTTVGNVDVMVDVSSLDFDVPTDPNEG